MLVNENNYDNGECSVRLLVFYGSPPKKWAPAINLSILFYKKFNYSFYKV
jgi:hypothetical protein